MDEINKILNTPQYQPYLAVLKGFRNGAVYGAKIRFPHALVMTFLFRDGTIMEKMRLIFKLTYNHAKNLAFFVFLYKSMMLAQRQLRDGKEKSSDSFFAGLVGGYLIFGNDNSVNNQIVLYLLSRITVGLAKWSVKKGVVPSPPPGKSFPIMAAAVWGVVMWLFRHDRDTLQGSLQASMQYLYNDSEVWSNVNNFLLYNTQTLI